MDPNQLWAFLPIGYLLSIAIETPVLLVGLSRRHSLRDRLLAGVWLTACTYPIVVIVMPLMMPPDKVSDVVSLAVEETFAPVAECILFWLVWIRGCPANRRATLQDMATVIVANLCSFGFGELAQHWGWLT